MVLFIEKMQIKMQLSQKLYIFKMLTEPYDNRAHFALQNWCFLYFFKIFKFLGYLAQKEEIFQKITPWRKNQVFDFCAMVLFSNIYGTWIIPF